MSPGQDSRRRVTGDAAAIAVGYLASFAYPLVSLPLLARVLGPELLGVVMVQLAVLQLVVHTTDFGFNTSSLRRAALAPGARARGRIIAETLRARTAVWLVCAVLVLGAHLIVPSLRPHLLVMACGLLVVLVGAWYHSWMLQALGRPRAFALIMAVTRLLALLGLVLTVRAPEDAALAVLWQFAPQAMAAVIAAALLWRAGEQVTRTKAARPRVREALHEAAPLFIANAAVMITGTANALVLGAVSTPTQVAYYGAAERFGNAVRGVMRGVGDAMLPRLAAGASELRRFLYGGILAAYTMAGTGLLVFAGPVIPWYLGPGMEGAIAPTRLLGIAILFAGVTSVMTLRATAAHRYGTVARLTTLAMGLHVVGVVLGAYMHGAVGVGIALVVSEAALAALFLADVHIHRSATPLERIGPR